MAVERCGRGRIAVVSGSVVFLFALLVFAGRSFVELERCVIRTSNGYYKGLYSDAHGKAVCSYLGVRYAEPPVGNLRFARTRPLKNISSVELVRATTFGPSCIQDFPEWARHMMRPRNNDMSEDCLFLNIWTPEIPKNSTAPIIVWIHGGGFQFGSGSLNETDGELLSQRHGIVVITINYRLNAFGFLNLQTDEISGNMGLYDQAAALNWISENAAHFKGDPNRVTLWGQGMGSISISAHLVSPVTRHLFNQAIMQTGSIFTTEVMYSRFEEVEKELLQIIGCVNQSSEVSCLRNSTIDDLMKAVRTINTVNPISFMFSPYDDFFGGLSPKEMREDLSPHISPSLKSVLMGFNSDEGSLLVHAMLPKDFSDNDTPNITSIKAGRQILQELFGERFHVPIGVAQTGIIDALSSNSMSRDEIVKAIHGFVGENVFVCPTIEFAEHLSVASINTSIHMYHWTQRTSYNQLPDWYGTIHNEEVPIMFGYPLRFPEDFTSEELRFSERAMATIAHFTKTGQAPKQFDVNWPRYSVDGPNYMILKPGEARTEQSLYHKSCSLFKLAIELS